MTDYSKPFRGVAYFGIWAEETADSYGIRSAIEVLADALNQCVDDDVRQRPELISALRYLSENTARPVYVNRFRKALDEPDPTIRLRVASGALKDLCRRLDQ